MIYLIQPTFNKGACKSAVIYFFVLNAKFLRLVVTKYLNIKSVGKMKYFRLANQLALEVSVDIENKRKLAPKQR